MEKVFPPSNLPGGAVPWGREVVSRLLGGGAKLSQGDRAVENARRSFSGRLGGISSQLKDLQDRSMEVISLPSMSVSGSTSVDPFPAYSETFSFSETPDTRTALLTLSGVASNSTTSFSNDGDRIAVTVTFRSQTVLSALVQISSPASTPPEWLNDAKVSTQSLVEIPGGSSPQFTLTIRRVGGYYFQQVPPFAELPSPASTVTLHNAQLVLERSGRV